MTYTTGDTLLNKYRIERLLGRGGFAEVYLATHLQLNAPRALKLLRRDAPGLGSSDYRLFEERFQLEAQLGAMFDHPNLVRVYDFERDEDTLILAMEYCPGGSLADRLQLLKSKGERLEPDQAVHIGVDTARGLAALHHKDLVHRDLKPSNILLDSHGHAKVSDLGLAQTPGGFSQRSLLGSLAPHHPGTPGYMSPEQEKLTDYLRPASDVYTLGVVLFEALTGRMLQNLKPGTRLKSLRPDAPGWLDELLAQMLMDDPKLRPWDGEEVLELVEQGSEEKGRLLAAQERQTVEEKARLEAEKQQRRVAAQGQRIAHPGSRAGGQPRSKASNRNNRSVIVWIGVVLTGLVVITLGTIGLVNLLMPNEPNPAQADTMGMPTTTAADVPTATTSTLLPTRSLPATAPAVVVPDQAPQGAEEMVDFLISQVRHFKGSPDARVTLIEFSDFQ